MYGTIVFVDTTFASAEAVLAADSEGSVMPEPYVLRIELDDAAKSDLGRITKELQVDTGEAIGTALGMEAFLLEQVGDGKRVVVIDKEGRQRELMVKMGAGTDGGRGDHSR